MCEEQSIPILLLTLILYCLSAYVDVRTVSYNIKDFWLRFDGGPGTITNEGAELDVDDLEKLDVVATIINEKKPDVIGILESASLVELLFFNKQFLEEKYRCWSF